MHQVLDITQAPIVFSHSNARALCNHPRNVPDDVLKRVPQNGGVVMLTFVPEFINQAALDWARPLKDEYTKGRKDIDRAAAYAARAKELGPAPKATLEQLCDHIEYVVQAIGLKHVGIGSDFFGGDTPDGLEDVSRFPHLLAELIRRGWSESAIAAIASGNFLRVFRAVERVGRALRQGDTGKLVRHEDFVKGAARFEPRWRG
jgi:membrane dipeptidase